MTFEKLAFIIKFQYNIKEEGTSNTLIDVPLSFHFKAVYRAYSSYPAYVP